MAGLLDSLQDALYTTPKAYWGDKAKTLASLLSDSATAGAEAYNAGTAPVNTLGGLLEYADQAKTANRGRAVKLADMLTGPVSIAGREVTQKDIDDAMMAVSMAPLGMTAWHGSPHKFDKFDMSKIGTGEGAQAYGHGLYASEAPAVAQEYQRNLAAKGMTIDGIPIESTLENYNIQQLVGEYGRDLSKLKTKLTEYVHQYSSNPYADIKSATKIINAIDKGKFDPKGGGYLYKVDIPDEAVARFLDWDKPLSQQAPEVQKALQRAAEIRAKQTGGAFGPLDMGQAGKDVVPSIGEGRLKQSGIHGIRYLDGGSRGAGQGSSNFVLFDDQLPRILETNGVPTGNQAWKPGEWGGLLGQ